MTPRLGWSCCLLITGLLPLRARAAPAPAPVTIAVAAEQFEFKGIGRSSRSRRAGVAGAPAKAVWSAAVALRVPAAGRYRVWVRSRDWPQDRPGTRTFVVELGGKRVGRAFGRTGVGGFSWEDGGWVDLPPGPLMVSLPNPEPFARFQGLILTTDPKRSPPAAKPVDERGIVPSEPLRLVGSSPSTRPRGELKLTSDRPAAAALANEHVRVEFAPAAWSHGPPGVSPTVAVRTFVRQDGRWVDAEGDDEAEGYFAVVADAAAEMRFHHFYPRWAREANPPPVTVEAGGVTVRTIGGRTTGALSQAGTSHRLVPKSATQVPQGVRIEFHPSPAGTAEALWTLPPGGRAASVALTLTPAAGGQVALGYEMFFRRDVADVAELLLPMMWHRRRMPLEPTTLLGNCAPTPIALAQTPGEAPRTFAVLGEPADLPYEWPSGERPVFGLSIGDDAGRVQPSIWGPVIGTPAAAATAGRPVRLRFRVLVQGGDWYAGYRTAADEVFALRDYRRNVATSLTDAALNMIDLIMDDARGGWWDRAKSFYQIESKNGGTHASPMTLLSLYRLTADERLYRERALPTMAFALSRDGPHFSPEPADAGPYAVGSMDGPMKLFGTSTYGGLWELTGRRSDAFAAVALPPGVDVRPTAGYSHAQPFDEWLARHLMSGDPKDLERACELADRYVEAHVRTPPTRDLGAQPFFYISFVPNWEGLLRLYEVTGHKRYLDAAAFGARQLMTGIWTQPVIPAGPLTIHAGGRFDAWREHQWWKGAERYRLGWPHALWATPEKTVPAWVVSNVGLGFEQPITFNPRGVARQIFESAWAPHFLRLYRHTGDAAFMTYARNATVGRWGNYPGYYITGHTDMPQDPRYPLVGPDVTDVYYHHIPPHLAWTIDYLVSEAEVLSGGRIRFPSLRQHGYAYFDSRIFGHAPGQIFDDDAAAWLLFRRGLVAIDNVQLNHLTAHGPGGFHVVLTNQSHEPQTATLTLSPAMLKFDATQPLPGRLRIGTGAATAVTFVGGRLQLTVPPRGLATVTVPRLRLDVPAHRPADAVTPPAAAEQGIVTVAGDAPATRAAALRVRPGPWDAYVWSAATPQQATAAALHYSLGGGEWKQTDDPQYPFEFTIPIEDEQTAVCFRLDLTRPDGSSTRGNEGVVRAGRR